jgi:hypothetical protein
MMYRRSSFLVGEAGWARSQIMRPRESLAICKRNHSRALSIVTNALAYGYSKTKIQSGNLKSNINVRAITALLINTFEMDIHV